MKLHEINNAMMEILPDKFSNKIGRDVLNKLELLINQDSELEDTVFDNLVNFKEILLEGKIPVKTFVDATLFSSYYLLGHSKTTSYTKVFPDRIAKFVSEGKTNRAISHIINAFHRSVLVQKLLGQCAMPSHVMFRNVFFKAVKTQVEIMEDTNVSATVRQKAACSLMGHLKEPEVQKMELEVTHNSEMDMIKELMNATKVLANTQRKAIESGDMDAGEIAHSSIIEGEFEEKGDEQEE